MYTRYELYLDGEPQDVGFMVGLNELDLDYEIQDYIMEDFNANLPFPKISEKHQKQIPLAYFTEKGLERFQKSIQQLLDVYETYNFFDVVKIEESLFDKTIIYEDQYQVVAI